MLLVEILQLGNKFAKETILFLCRNEKYFWILFTYQRFGYNIGQNLIGINAEKIFEL